MKYIVCKSCTCKFLGKSINLRKGATCEEEKGVIYHNNQPICYKTSQNAYDYFARNDDGQGKVRFGIIEDIFEEIAKKVAAYNESYAEIVSTFTEETTDEAKEEALSVLENVPARIYHSIKEAYPTFIKNSDIFTFDFYNANKEELEAVLELCR